MIVHRIPRLGAYNIWRDAARQMLNQDIHPDQIVWADAEADAELFVGNPAAAVTHTETARVPRQFLDIASKVVAHKNPERFARLYGVLWRLRSERDLLENPADRDVITLIEMAKNVSRDCHKMKAFVRFRELPTDGQRRGFAAWFEPEHFIVELTGPFFARRFADMDWIISTPVGVSQFAGGTLSFHPPDGNRHAITDDTENLWRTYYANIFNPARLKIKAMQSEMPKKYWKNLPEALLIPELIAGAEKRVQSMRDRQPTEATSTLAKIKAPTISRVVAHEVPFDSIENLNDAARHCTRCSLQCNATQTVCGTGSTRGGIVFVGEQPGDQEDIKGTPFVGPAGQILDEALRHAIINRNEVYLTNAVKHFKFSSRGKRRMHERPNHSEILACKWWLDNELEIIKPRLVVALGATALLALTGNGKDIATRRGTLEQSLHGDSVFVTYHPSAILRNQDAADRLRHTFFADVAKIAEIATHSRR